MARLEALQRWERLRGMKPREVLHRTQEVVSIARERLHVAPKPAPAPHPFKEYLASVRGRFYGGVSHVAADFATARFPEILSAGGGPVDVLNLGPVDLGSPVDWNRDPFTGSIWERRFWADYDLENDPAGRDSKIVHELNRHQFLPRLAKVFALTGNEGLASEAVGHLESWIEQNPPGQGVQWNSSLEIAIRAISWMWTLFLLAPSRSLTEPSARRIGDSLFAQIDHIHRHLSVYSSPNTHLIGEAAALFLAGLAFGDCRCARSWLSRGSEILAEEAQKQVFDDGVYGERSSYYHCYALDFYMQALVLAEANGVAMPRVIRDRVEKMLEFLMHLTRPDGTTPLLGDDDGGRALALHRGTYRKFRDALSTGAVLFRRGDFKAQSGQLWEETYWLLGEPGCRLYDSLEAELPGRASVFFPAGGYAVQRSGWGARDSHAVFDFGGLGLFNGGHAHAGCLSVSLFAEGRECLVDPGTFVYNSAPEWRKYFRSTRAHNTVVVDGRDQAEEGSTFRWNTRIASSAVRREEPPVECIEAQHEGYAPLIHRRRVLFVQPGYWIVTDAFRGTGQHSFEFLFQLGSDFVPTVKTLPEADVTVLPGWCSQGYGHKRPIPVLSAHCQGTAENVAAMTLLIPGARGTAVEKLPVKEGAAIVCAIQFATHRDIVMLCPGGGETAIEDIRFRGELCWVRKEAGEIRHVFTSAGGEIVPEEATCVPFAAS